MGFLFHQDLETTSTSNSCNHRYKENIPIKLIKQLITQYALNSCKQLCFFPFRNANCSQQNLGKSVKDPVTSALMAITGAPFEVGKRTNARRHLAWQWEAPLASRTRPAPWRMGRITSGATLSTEETNGNFVEGAMMTLFSLERTGWRDAIDLSLWIWFKKPHCCAFCLIYF